MNGAVLAGFELSWIFYRFGFFRLSILSIFRLSIWVFPFIDFIDFRLSIWVFSFIDFIDFRLSISVFSFIDFIDFRLSFSIFKSIMHFQCNIPESRVGLPVGAVLGSYVSPGSSGDFKVRERFRELSIVLNQTI